MGREGPIGNAQLFPLLDRYLADRSMLFTDGAVAYASYKATYPHRMVDLHQLSHTKCEYVRYEYLKGAGGISLGKVAISTNDIDGGWSNVRLRDRLEGGNLGFQVSANIENRRHEGLKL